MKVILLPVNAGLVAEWVPYEFSAAIYPTSLQNSFQMGLQRLSYLILQHFYVL